jgi:hypothetical protein
LRQPLKQGCDGTTHTSLPFHVSVVCRQSFGQRREVSEDH